MASIRKRGKKGQYSALFRDADGRLIERATKTTDKKLAQDMADEWEAMAKPVASAQQVERMRRVVAEFHAKLIGSEMRTMTMRSFSETWLNSRRAEVSRDTIAAYETVATDFLQFLGDRADRDVFAVQKQDVVRWRDALVQRIAPTTAAARLKILRMIFKAAVEDGWAPQNPCEGVRGPRTTAIARETSRRPFSVAELRTLLAACPDDEWRAMVVRGYYTGQRLRDIALMRRDQEDPIAKTVWFSTSKTGKRVILAMHPAYVDFVLSEPSGDDPRAWLHPGAASSVMSAIDEGRKAATVTLSVQFGRILEKAGLRMGSRRAPTERTSGRRRANELTFHSLRHSFVSHLADAGISRTVVMDMVGHDSPAVNQSYTHLDAGTKLAAVERLPNILGCE